MIAHEVSWVTSMEIGPGKTNICKVEESFIRFRNMMMVFDYVKGIVKEKE